MIITRRRRRISSSSSKEKKKKKEVAIPCVGQNLSPPSQRSTAVIDPAAASEVKNTDKSKIQ